MCSVHPHSQSVCPTSDFDYLITPGLVWRDDDVGGHEEGAVLRRRDHVVGHVPDASVHVWKYIYNFLYFLGANSTHYAIAHRVCVKISFLISPPSKKKPKEGFPEVSTYNKSGRMQFSKVLFEKGKTCLFLLFLLRALHCGSIFACCLSGFLFFSNPYFFPF